MILVVLFSDSIEGQSLHLINPLLNSAKGFYSTFLVLHWWLALCDSALVSQEGWVWDPKLQDFRCLEGILRVELTLHAREISIECS